MVYKQPYVSRQCRKLSSRNATSGHCTREALQRPHNLSRSCKHIKICLFSPLGATWRIWSNLYYKLFSSFAVTGDGRYGGRLVRGIRPLCSNMSRHGIYTVETHISWQSRDSISTLAPPWSFGLLHHIEQHDTVEIESCDCQDMRSRTLLCDCTLHTLLIL